MPYAVNNGVKLYWRETGSGPALLLIMGLGYSSDMWHHIEAGLAAHFRLVVFDNRGIGRSSPAAGPHLISTMAEDAAAVLDAVGIEQAFVLGMSMGGYIAQELVLSHPKRVKALVLACTACGGAHAVRPKQEVLDAAIARARMPAAEGVRAMIPYVYDPSTPQERIEADMVIRLAQYPDPDTYLGQIEGIRMWQSCDRLATLRVPTLILHGEHDELIPPANGQLLADHIRGSELHIIPHASHILPTDQPALIISLVTEFLYPQISK